MRKKIRCFIPKLTKEVMLKDTKYFNLSLEKLCNLIVREFGYESTIDIYKWSSHDPKLIINFNLTESNTKYFKDMFESSHENSEAEFFRKLFATYSNLHPSVREKIVHNSRFKDIEYASKGELLTKLAIKDDICDVKILSIKRNEVTGFNQVEVDLNEEVQLYDMINVELLKIY